MNRSSTFYRVSQVTRNATSEVGSWFAEVPKPLWIGLGVLGGFVAVVLVVTHKRSGPTPGSEVQALTPEQATSDGNAAPADPLAGATATLPETYHLRPSETSNAVGRVLTRGTTVQAIRPGRTMRNGVRIRLVRVTNGRYRNSTGWLFLPESLMVARSSASRNANDPGVEVTGDGETSRPEG